MTTSSHVTGGLRQELTGAQLSRSPRFVERATLAVACVGFFMVVLDTTVVNVALPSIGRGLGANLSDLQWVLDGYTLVFGALVFSAGHFADRWGASACFGVGVALFAACSIGCSFAPSPAVLLAARGVQGVAAAIMLPSSLSLVSEMHVNARKRARAIAIWSSAGGAAVAAGPVIGGVLTEAFSWRAVFIINVPVALAALCALRWVPRSRSGEGSFDLLGVATAVAALGALTYAVIEGGRAGFGDERVLVALVICGLAAIGLVTTQRGETSAIPLRVFSQPAVLGPVFAGVALYFTFYGAVFALSLFFQDGLGEGPAEAGLMFLPMTGLITIATLFSGFWTGRSGWRRPMAVGLGAMGLGLVAMSLLDSASSLWLIGVSTLPVGIGCGVAGPTIPTALLATLPRERSGVASGLANSLRQLGATLGVAVFGAFVGTHGSPDKGMHIAFLVSAATVLLAATVIVYMRGLRL
ncbi:MAG: MFS transporter [Solirubrobacteraceae bacterium]